MAEPLIVFAHGAGASSRSDWMKGWTRRLGTLGRVVPFDYPYMAAGKKRPDRHPVLLEAHRAVLAEARAAYDGPVVLAGKSMGSRIGCHLSLEEPVDALVCLGFPLQTIGKTPKTREEVLLALRTPVMFCQGSKDRMGPLDLFASVREKMTARSELYVVDGGKHGLEVGKRQLAAEGRTQDDVDDGVLAAIAAFLERVL